MTGAHDCIVTAKLRIFVGNVRFPGQECSTVSEVTGNHPVGISRLNFQAKFSLCFSWLSDDSKTVSCSGSNNFDSIGVF